VFDWILLYINHYRKKISFSGIKTFFLEWFAVAKINIKLLPSNIASVFISIKNSIIIGLRYSINTAKFTINLIIKFIISTFYLVVNRIISIKLKNYNVRWSLFFLMLIILDLAFFCLFGISIFYYFSLLVLFLKKKILLIYAYLRVFFFDEKLNLLLNSLYKFWYKFFFTIRIVYTIAISFFFGSNAFYQAEDYVFAIFVVTLLFLSYFILVQTFSDKFIFKTKKINNARTNKLYFKFLTLVGYFLKILKNMNNIWVFISLKLSKIYLFVLNSNFVNKILIKDLFNNFLGLFKLNWLPVFKKTSYFGLLRSYVTKWLKK